MIVSQQNVYKNVSCLRLRGVGVAQWWELMWPGFDFQIRCHMWVEFFGSLLCIERFSPGAPVFALLKNQHYTFA